MPIRHKFKLGQIVWFKRCDDIPSEWEDMHPGPSKLKVRIVARDCGYYAYECQFLPPYDHWCDTWGVQDYNLMPIILPGPDAYKQCNDLSLFPMREE